MNCRPYTYLKRGIIEVFICLLISGLMLGVYANNLNDMVIWTTLFSLFGSTNPDLDVCRTKITATTQPPLPGIKIDFKIAGNKGEDEIKDEIYYTIEGAQPGSLTANSAITDSSGKASVYLISSEDASNPDTQLYYYEAVKCLYDDIEIDTVWVRYDPPEYDFEIFLDPETEKPLDYIIADGESKMMNRLKITYNSIPIPNHTIKWKFRFWKYETLDNASLNKYGVHFDELSEDQQEKIFNTTPPDYEGTDSPIYGSITQTSKTDSSGIAKSTYTVGTVGGFIEIEAQDENINIAIRGSLKWRKKVKRKKKYSEKVTVKIVNPPEWVLVYNGLNAPVKSVTAKGNPPGGEYQWFWSTKSGGSGKIEFLDGSNINIRGTFYSNPNPTQKYDVELKVIYTLFDQTAVDTCLLTVRVPIKTTSIGTQIEYYNMGWRRKYYHQLKDQYNEIINFIGIPVSEDITFLEGDKGFGTTTGSGQTNYYDLYGISVEDILFCPKQNKWSKWRQILTAGGWSTSPVYYIYFDPEPCGHWDKKEEIWKDTYNY